MVELETDSAPAPDEANRDAAARHSGEIRILEEEDGEDRESTAATVVEK